MSDQRHYHLHLRVTTDELRQYDVSISPQYSTQGFAGWAWHIDHRASLHATWGSLADIVGLDKPGSGVLFPDRDSALAKAMAELVRQDEAADPADLAPITTEGA